MKRFAVAGLVVAVLCSASFAAAQDDAVIKELSRMEDAWAAAAVKHDGAGVGRLLAPGYLAMGDDGIPQDKAALVQQVNTNKTAYVSMKNGDYKGRVFGNTAIIVGITTSVVKTATGTETQRSAWTDTWMKQADGQWLCIASQSARLAK